MGLFLGLNGVVGGEIKSVRTVLAEYGTEHSGFMRPATPAEDEATRLVIASGRTGPTILYPGEFLEWEHAGEFLSIRLGKPVFSFHIHDGDLWMFQLYVAGRAVTAFNTIPDYWGDLPEGEAAFMRGDAAVLARHVPHLAAGDVERYFVPRKLDEDEPGKAYPDDEFSMGEDWQLVDFMRKLGFVYPLDEKGEPLGECHSFRAD